MTDIALIQKSGGEFDIALADGDLMSDSGLRTAVILSLLLDRRANSDDVLPDGSDDRRGYWGDAWPTVNGDQIGSRLWLLSREKDLDDLDDVRNRAVTYAREALQWLIEDGIASAVGVQAQTVQPGMLGIYVEITRQNGDTVQEQFDYVWEAAY